MFNLLLQCLHSLCTRALNGLPVKHIYHWLPTSYGVVPYGSCTLLLLWTLDSE